MASWLQLYCAVHLYCLASTATVPRTGGWLRVLPWMNCGLLDLAFPSWRPGSVHIAMRDWKCAARGHGGLLRAGFQKLTNGLLEAGSPMADGLCFAGRRYMTQACRINGEKHTQFPFTCNLSDLLRARRVLAGA